jgi:hypothetical protein
VDACGGDWDWDCSGSLLITAIDAVRSASLGAAGVVLVESIEVSFLEAGGFTKIMGALFFAGRRLVLPLPAVVTTDIGGMFIMSRRLIFLYRIGGVDYLLAC